MNRRENLSLMLGSAAASMLPFAGRAAERAVVIYDARFPEARAFAAGSPLDAVSRGRPAGTQLIVNLGHTRDPPNRIFGVASRIAVRNMAAQRDFAVFHADLHLFGVDVGCIGERLVHIFMDPIVRSAVALGPLAGKAAGPGAACIA